MSSSDGGTSVSRGRSQRPGSVGVPRRGLVHVLVTVGVPGREAHGEVPDCLGGQSAVTVLAAAMAGVFDAGDDLDPQLLSSAPATPVQNVRD